MKGAGACSSSSRVSDHYRAVFAQCPLMAPSWGHLSIQTLGEDGHFNRDPEACAEP